MPRVHASAILEGEVDLGDDVVIGPHCVLTGPVSIGSGSHLIGNAYIQGPARIGARNVVYPFTCLGFAPQHTKFDPATPGRGLEIGDDNTFREQVTVHRAYMDDGPTRVGSRGFFMSTAHIGHDCQVGDDVTMAGMAILAGHVEIADRVLIGGQSAVHQFVRVGRGAMVGGCAIVTLDVPPFFTCTDRAICTSVNVIGMRRNGWSRDDIETVRWAHRTLYRTRSTIPKALERLRERQDEPLVAEIISFIEASKRGIALGQRRERAAHRDEARA